MDGKNKIKMTVLDMALIAMFSAILLIQEEALTFIPNVQLTVFLLVLYSKRLGFVKTSIIVIIHVFLDNLVMSSFSLVWTPAMFVGWLLIPLVICTVFRKVENFIVLAIAGAILSFTYCWCYILPNYLVMHIMPLKYLEGDILFECILALSSFVSILFLYIPCKMIFIKFRIGKIDNEEELIDYDAIIDEEIKNENS